MSVEESANVNDEHSDPEKVVRSFIADMHEWELTAIAAGKAARKTEDPASYHPLILTAMNEVIARWCTPRERKYGRLGSYSSPPEYQPEHERILEVALESPRRTAVYTQRDTGFRHKRMYVLLKKAGQWRIDSVKWQLYDGDWTVGIL